jgi:hypothetical protein
VVERLKREGHSGLRHAHGSVFQHLVAGPRTVTELAKLLEVSQQAASKSVAELTALGYLEDTESRIGARGASRCRSAAAPPSTGRGAPRAVRAEIVERPGEAEVTRARRLLASVLEHLGRLEAVRTRRIRAASR